MTWQDSISYIQGLRQISVLLESSHLLSTIQFLGLLDSSEEKIKMAMGFHITPDRMVQISPSFLLNGHLYDLPYALVLNENTFVRKIESKVSNDSVVLSRPKNIGIPSYQESVLLAQQFVQRIPSISEELSPFDYGPLGISINYMDITRIEREARRSFYDTFSGYIEKRYLMGGDRERFSENERDSLQDIINPILF